MIERQTEGRQLANGSWENDLGMVGPYQPGVGPRNSPIGEFPTGPEIGERLPEIVARAHDGSTVDVHAARAGRPAVVVFYRSAVW